jgi:zinc ribbon protein
MIKDEATDEYAYYCSSCRAVIDEDDKFCRQCGADTSEVIEQPSDKETDHLIAQQRRSTELTAPSHHFVISKASVGLKPRADLGSAAILLFVMAAFHFVNQVVNGKGQVSGTLSTLPVLANVVIGIGLLRPQGFWSMSQNGYRIWAIIRCLALPVLIAIGVIEPTVNVTGAFIIHSPELLIAAGLLTILLGPTPSPKRVALGVTLSVVGFIGSAIFIGLASK